MRVVPQVVVPAAQLRVPVQGAVPVREPCRCSSRCPPADLEGKKRIYADPEFRAPLREPRRRRPRSPARGATRSSPSSRPIRRSRSAASREVARERGVHPVDLALDLALADEPRGALPPRPSSTPTRTTSPSCSPTRRPMLGLSDAGAHASQLCDAGAPDRPARPLGAREGRADARGGGTPPHLATRRRVRHPRPRAPRGRPGRRRRGVRSRHGRLQPAAPRARLCRRGADRLVADATRHPRGDRQRHGRSARTAATPSPPARCPAACCAAGGPDAGDLGVLGGSGIGTEGTSMTPTYPIISADSHITEPPNTYVDHIDADVARRAPRTGAASTARRRVLDRRHEAADADRARRRGGQAGRGDPRCRGSRFEELHRGGWDPVRAARRPGSRRRRGRGDLPDRRHGALQPPGLRLQEGLLRRLQPLDRGVLRDRRPRGCSAAARPRCARRRRASPTCTPIKRARPARRDDARQSGASRTTTRPLYDAFWEAAVELGLPLSFHILTTRDELVRCAGPQMNGFLVDHPRLPGHHGHADLRRRLRAPPRR